MTVISHSIEQQYPLILRSLHDQLQEIPLPSRLKPERMHYSAIRALLNIHLCQKLIFGLARFCRWVSFFDVKSHQ
jgi:hypothetical protein